MSFFAELLLIVKESLLAVLLSRQIATLYYTGLHVRTAYQILVILVLSSASYRGIQRMYWMKTTAILAACVLLKYMPYEAEKVDGKLNYAMIVVANQLPRVLSKLSYR